MNGLAFALRRSFRAHLRRPGFSMVVVLTMAIAIGANVCIAGYLSYFVWPTVEAPDPGSVHWLFQVREEESRGSLSYLDWRDVVAARNGLSQHAAWLILGTSVVTPSQTLHAWGFAVSGDYFHLFGARPQVGRLLQPADDTPGAPRVMVLSDSFWRRHFDADPDVVGTTVDLDGEHRSTVVGVAPPGFQGPGIALSVYVPLATAAPLLNQPLDRVSAAVNVLARLAPSATREGAEAALAATAQGLDEILPADEPRHFSLVPATEHSAFGPGDLAVIRGARMLMAAVGLLLVLATANVAHLMLARAVEREREWAVMASLGAGRWRIGAHLLAEGAVLALAGGLLGLPVAWVLTVVMEGYLLHSMPVGMGEWGISSSVIENPTVVAAVAIGTTLLTGILFGLAPLARLRRLELAGVLRAGSGGSARVGRARRILVVAQVALSVVLLMGAALLARNIALALERDVGFAGEGLAIAAFYLPFDRRGADEGPVKDRYQQLLESARELPGVRHATLASRIPLTPAARQVLVDRDHRGAAEPVDYDIVGEGYFATLGVPVLRGRAFEQRDREESPPVVMVNRAAADRYWPGGEAVGSTLSITDPRAGHGASWQVIGVVGNIRSKGVMSNPEPMVYFTFHQKLHRRLTLLARVDGPLEAPLRSLLRERFPEFAVLDLVPFSEQIERTLSEQRMYRDLAVAFGLVGLGLAALSLFALLDYSVSQRTREMGIRRALGASRTKNVRLVLVETMALVAWGLGLGSVAGAAATRALESLLFGLDAHDPSVFLAVLLVVALVAASAALLPALRVGAMRPMEALRHD